MKSTFRLMILPLALALLAGCSTAPTRIQSGGPTALTTMDVDLLDFKNAADQIVQGLLVHPAIAQFSAQNKGRLPTIRVGQITNKSDRNIDLGQLAGRISEDLLNSGLVEIIAEDSGSVDASMEDSFTNNSKLYTAAKADFYLEGNIMLLQAKEGSMREKTYTFQMRLNDRNRRVRFQRSIDVTKQGSRGGTASW